jgi:tetratricopeptide (TPR) repeat protein
MTGLTKKILIFVVVMAAVAAFGWFGRKAWKHYTENNLITQARADFAKKDLRDADLCLRRVLQIDPMSVEGSRMIATLLDAEGSPAAVGWRIRVAKLEPDNVTNLYVWVETALRSQNLPSAAEGLAEIPDKYKNTTEYHKLSGAVAWTSGRLVEAEKECTLALQMDPTNRAIMLNLATIQLAVTNNRSVNQTGRNTLDQLASDPSLGMLALHHLQVDAVTRKSFNEALGYAKRINSNPAATFSDKVEYLQLMRTTESVQADPWLASLKQIAAYEPLNAYTLGRWMVAAEGPKTAYQWLGTLPTTTQTNIVIVLLKTDCQIGMKDWSGLLAAVNAAPRPEWGQKEYYRLALTSLAQRQLGDTDTAQRTWQSALTSAAQNPESLALLSQVTGVWGWIPERKQTLEEAIAKHPDQRWATQQLTGLLYSQGDTAGLTKLMTQMQRDNPEDSRLKNNLADVLLLQRTDIDKSYQLSSEAYQSATNNPFYISTYAYALLMKNKPDMALKIIGNLKPEYLKIPSIAVYYGVIQVQTGHKDLAREPLTRAAKANLLPEEKAIVTSAMKQL